MNRILQICDLGTIDYQSALSIQEQLHSARASGTIPDTLLLLEHEHVFTMGRSAKPANLLESPGNLIREGISVEKTGRGGDVTYHGPGQLVGYPIVHLKESHQSVLSFINLIEQVIIHLLHHYNITAGRDPRNRGVWVGNSKIAAIGLKISRQVSMHGFALNVSTNLDFYKRIIPCGIKDAGVTSMQQLGHCVDMQSAKDYIAGEFKRLFNYERIEYIQHTTPEKT